MVAEWIHRGWRLAHLRQAGVLGVLLALSLGAFAQKADSDAALFLEQATWGPNAASTKRLADAGKTTFLKEQFEAPVTQFPAPPAADTRLGDYQRLFFQYAVHNPDQLRQRVAFALSQIVVVSGNTIGVAEGFIPYYNLLLKDAFGNYRDLLVDISLSPAMGDYLDNVNNQKPDPARNLSPNENYAREFLQLFTVGTELLNEDGTVQTDANGVPLPTYTEEIVKQLSNAFTGWTYAPRPGQPARRTNPRNYTAPMVAWEPSHDQTEKELFDGFRLPAGRTTREDLDGAIDHVFQHPNVAPFISVRLIRALVTSNPSPAYVRRVVQVFKNNGAGVRGDLKAVVSAILLDPEASLAASPGTADATGQGHLSEPVLFAAKLMRALEATVEGTNNINRYTSQMGQSVFFPPSVFSYYHLDHKLTGTELAGPEFELHTSATSIQRANFVGLVVDRRLGNGVTYNFDELAKLSPTPDALIDELDRRLTHGTLPGAVKQVVRKFVMGTTNATARVERALYLIATSPYAMVTGERSPHPGRSASGRRRAYRH